MVSQASESDFTSRIVRVLRLDRSVFNEVEADDKATSQALLVVVVGALSSGIAGLIYAMVTGPQFGSPVFDFLYRTVSALIGWAVWSFVAFFVGTRFFGGTATYGEMLRTLGFSYAPYLFGLLGGLPIVGGIIGLVIAVWSLVAGYFAIREGLDIDNTKAILTIIVSAIVLFIVIAIIAVLTGILVVALGLGAAAVSPAVR